MLNKKQIIYALEEVADETIEGIKLSEVRLDEGKTSISIDLVIKAPRIENNDIKANLDANKVKANDMESIRKSLLGEDK